MYICIDCKQPYPRTLGDLHKLSPCISDDGDHTFRIIDDMEELPRIRMSKNFTVYLDTTSVIIFAHHVWVDDNGCLIAEDEDMNGIACFSKGSWRYVVPLKKSE